MDLNADFSQQALVHSDAIPWVPSPMPGVERRMLDRIGGEVARATTIVRFAPDSAFSSHTHTGGEEFIVLNGVFQDEHGDYPAGTYVRNPPTSHHTPRSAPGCTIFVKLWQFDLTDRTHVRLRMHDTLGPEKNGLRTGLLHRDPRETVRLITLRPGARLTLPAPDGSETLILSGAVRHTAPQHNTAQLTRGSWLRLPQGRDLVLTAENEGAEIWVKTGHLAHASPPAPSTRI